MGDQKCTESSVRNEIDHLKEPDTDGITILGWMQIHKVEGYGLLWWLRIETNGSFL
jgi:hypothetical protein